MNIMLKKLFVVIFITKKEIVSLLGGEWDGET